jgi:hypothetical protein
LQLFQKALEYGVDCDLTLAIALLTFARDVPLEPVIALACERGAHPDHIPGKCFRQKYPQHAGKSMLQLALIQFWRQQNSSALSSTLNVLLDHGADVNLISENSDEKTALQSAIDEGCLQCMKILLDRGARVDREAYDKVMVSQKQDTESRELMTDLMKMYDLSLETCQVVSKLFAEMMGPSSGCSQGEAIASEGLLLTGRHHHGTETREMYGEENGMLAWTGCKS